VRACAKCASPPHKATTPGKTCLAKRHCSHSSSGIARQASSAVHPWHRAALYVRHTHVFANSLTASLPAPEHLRSTQPTQLLPVHSTMLPEHRSHLDTAYAVWLVGAKQLQHLPHAYAHGSQAMQDGAVKANAPADLRVYVQRVVVTRQPWGTHTSRTGRAGGEGRGAARPTHHRCTTNGLCCEPQHRSTGWWPTWPSPCLTHKTATTQWQLLLGLNPCRHLCCLVTIPWLAMQSVLRSTSTCIGLTRTCKWCTGAASTASTVPHLYSAAWSACVVTSRTASGGLLGGVLAAVAARLRGSGCLIPSKGPAATTQPASVHMIHRLSRQLVKHAFVYPIRHSLGGGGCQR
jgi:hypothetical protein